MGELEGSFVGIARFRAMAGVGKKREETRHRDGLTGSTRRSVECS